MHFKWTFIDDMIFNWKTRFPNSVKRPTQLSRSIFKISSPNFQDCFIINWTVTLWTILCLSVLRKILWLFTWNTSSPHDDMSLYKDCDDQCVVMLKCFHRVTVWSMYITSKTLNYWCRLHTKKYLGGAFCSIPVHEFLLLSSIFAQTPPASVIRFFCG